MKKTIAAISGAAILVAGAAVLPMMASAANTPVLCNEAYANLVYNTPSGNVAPGFYFSAAAAQGTSTTHALVLSTEYHARCFDSSGNEYDIVITVDQYNLILSGGSFTTTTTTQPILLASATVR